VPDTKKANPAPSPNADLWALVRRAEAGDATAMPALRTAMDANGTLVEIFGDLAAQVERSILRAITGKDHLFREASERKLAKMRADVAGPSPSPLERLLAERIALCWLVLHDAEVRFAQSTELTWKQVEFWQRRIDASHRRYLSAIKTLATVRKLALPAVQVNIGRKQVNVLNATTGGTEGSSAAA
jgi:hypothetical protein